MHIDQRNLQSVYSLKDTTLETTDPEKDLDVTITSNLKFSKQCIEVEKKPKRILGYIKIQFGHWKREIELCLYTSLFWPHQFWNPTIRKNIARLKRVQTGQPNKLIPLLRHKGYEDRLLELNLLSLNTSRLHDQLIEVLKLLRGFDNVGYREYFPTQRGYNQKSLLQTWTVWEIFHT